MLARKILMIGVAVVAVTFGFVLGREYDRFAYAPSLPNLKGQKELSLRVLLDRSNQKNKDAYDKSLRNMKVDYFTLRDEYCTRFTPRSGLYAHFINVCFDKKSGKADVFNY